MKQRLWITVTLFFTVTSLMALNVEFKPDGNAIFKAKNEQIGSALTPLEILNGKTGDTEINIGKPEISRKGDTTVLRYKTTVPAMEIISSWRNTGKYLRNTVEVKNLSHNQIFLLIRQKLPLPGENFQYWNGRQLRKKLVRDLVNNELYNSFPMGCVYTSTLGMAIGIEPMQIFNHIENGLNIQKTPKCCYYGVKLVVDAEKSDKVEFVSFEFLPEYGYYNAVADFQNASPASFVPNPEVDPRVTRGSFSKDLLYYEKLWKRGDKLREYVRRQCGSWVWGYAPFQAAGDWYGRREVWENPDLCTAKIEIPNYDDFIARRKAAIAAHEEYNQAFMFYLITFCDEKLMKKDYPGIWITDKNTMNRITPWVFGSSIDCRVWGWGNKFGEDTVKAMHQIRDNLDVSGFAFDACAAPGIARTQTGVESAPGRAYDKDGVYVREAVAAAMYMDVAHSLKKGDYRLGCAGNMAGGGHSLYYVSVRSDILVSDGSFSNAFVTPVDQEVMRFMCGNKPFNYANEFDMDKYGSVISWRDYTPEKIREIYNALRDNIVLFTFRYGYYYNPHGAWGCEKIIRYIPIAQEVISSGFQTVPAIRVSSNLWFSRYGKDLNTCFFIGNQSLKPKQADIAIDCKYLGDGDYAFSHFDGNPLNSELDGRITKLSKKMTSKEIFLLRPVIAFPSGVTGVKAKASYEGDFTGGTATVSFEAAKPINGKIAFRLPKDCKAVEIRLNGKTIAKDVNYCNLKNITSGKLEFVWQSKIFHLSSKELLDFPFGKARIFLPDNADKFDRYAAKNISEYFRFYDNVTGSHIGTPMILDGNDIVPGSIRFVNGQTGVSLSPDGSLIISGETAKQRFELMFRVMRVLDQKYFYFGKFADPGSGYTINPATREMRKKGGIGEGENWPGM